MKFLQVAAITLSAGVLLSGCSLIGAKKAGLKVVTNVPAEISLDNTVMGQAPYENQNLSVKKYALKVSPSDSTKEAFETSVKLHSGYETQVEWTFGTTKDDSSGYVFEYEDAQNKAKAEIQLTATPDNVPVSVDGKNVGFTPLLIDNLDAGTHSIELQAPGYSSASRTVLLVKGKRILMTTKLSKEAAPAPTPTPEPDASDSATLNSTASAKKASPTPKPSVTPKPSTAPTASGSAATTSSGGIKKTTTTKPYVSILDTPTGFLRVRESSDTSAKEVYKLAPGSSVPYANASASGWLKVTYDGTSVGWVSSQYAKLVE